MAKLSHDHVNEIAKMLYQWSPNETLRSDNYYGSRALSVCGLLMDGQDVRRVASYLGRIRTAEIGFSPDPESDQSTARQIVDWWGGR